MSREYVEISPLQLIDGVDFDTNRPEWANYVGRDSRGWFFFSHRPWALTRRDLATGALERPEMAKQITGSHTGGEFLAFDLNEVPSSITLSQAIHQAKRAKAKADAAKAKAEELLLASKKADAILKRFGLSRV